MWPYGQTPPLEKCEQPDLKHPKAMLQNDVCPPNSPRGGGEGFASWPTDYLFMKRTRAGVVLCYPFNCAGVVFSPLLRR